MGQKLFFEQQDDLAKETHKPADKSGYVFGAHAAEDRIRDKDKRIPKTKKMYRKIVDQ
ncbi:hypothetical protein N7447_009446 [Penicillium robsamsonii]|uniref:uncharacterized protein n=1 Tax=Penicillium robsamsonii TaxID=1792511 RepID=UPI002546C8BD|nr:uncharacterized protein N7447_009446 [Penicillium robsamsonii]KAJ5817213.1 hypothetical protein N7447_009446 [Penicillium robsamsonii]